MSTRRHAICFLITFTLVAFAGLVQAQSYPAKPIRWVVPYSAGGGTDVLVRTVTQQLAQQIGQAIVVDNKPGGNTAIGASDVARSPADGYTILSADNGTLIFNSALYTKLTYKPESDFTPVTLLARTAMVLMVSQGSDIKDAKDFLAKAKASPGKFSYGSVGAGSPHHLAMEIFKVNAGLDLVHVPYRGAAPALADLVAGQISVNMGDLASGLGFIKSGKVRPLAVTSATRLPQLPNVPTFAELGIENSDAYALMTVVAPAGTPADTVAALQRQIALAIQQPVIRQKLVDFGFEPVGNTPRELAEILRIEVPRWHKLIRDQKISLE